MGNTQRKNFHSNLLGYFRLKCSSKLDLALYLVGIKFKMYETRILLESKFFGGWRSRYSIDSDFFDIQIPFRFRSLASDSHKIRTARHLKNIQARGKSLLKIAYVILVILKSHDFFSVIFCDFGDS